MIITTDRKEFDEALKDSDLAIMLIFKQDDQTAQKIEELAGKVESWNSLVLIQDLGILSKEEHSAWYKDPEHYTLLSKPDKDDSRKVVEQAALDDLRSPKGVIIVRKINAAFGSADESGS